MRRTARVKLNLLVTWGDYVVGLLICAFLTPYVLHTVGDTTYGVWLFINSIAGYSGLLNLGFGETVSRYVATHYARNETHRMNQVVNVVAAVYLCMGAVAVLAGLLLAAVAPLMHNWGTVPLSEVRLSFVLLGVNAALTIVGSVFGGVLVGIQRFDIERGSMLASGFARLVLTVLLLKQEHALLILSVVSLGMTLVENAGYVCFAFVKVPTLRFGPQYLSWQVFRECFSFSGFAFLHHLAQRLIWATDNIVIGLVLGAEAIVPYFIASRLSDFLSRPVKAVGMVLMPRAGELHATDRRRSLQTLVSKGVGFSFLLMTGFFVGAGFFGPMLIRAWVGPGYEQSHLLLMILLGARIVATPMEVVRAVLFGSGRVRVPALLYSAEAVANLLLTLLLIRPFGLAGVAWGTALPLLVVELGALLPYAFRQLGYEPSRLIQEAVAPQMPALVGLLVYCEVVVRLVPDGGWPELLAISAGGGLVLGSLALAAELYQRRLAATADALHGPAGPE